MGGACCSGDPKSACDPGLAGPSSGSGSGLPDTRTEEFAVGTAPDAPFGFVASSTPFVAPAAPGEGAHPAEQGKAMCLARSHLEHRSLLDIYSSPHMVRRTSIVCTIGPKTNSVDMMAQLRDAGMNIVRMNFSHGSYEYHGSVIANAREMAAKVPGKDGTTQVIAIALDTKGPEIRTGLTPDNAEVRLIKDSTITVTTDKAFAETCSAENLYVDYDNICKMLQVGSLIYLDDGLLSLRVESISADFVSCQCTVMNEGGLSSKKGVNLPNIDVDLPALSEKDAADLRFGVEQGVDMVFASFIRKAADIKAYRDVLGEDGAAIKIIAKIENHEGVRNFDEILAVTDGVMVARGDLGIEIPAQKVFVAQKAMIAKCNIAGKPVICATQMLESMTTNPRPTRAEVSDVANAVLDGADCVMLSGETAKGCYPLQAVTTMSECCLEAEACTFSEKQLQELRQLLPRPLGISRSVALGAVDASLQNQAAAIIVLTRSGDSARMVAQFRPRCPIVVVTRNAQTARQVHLYRGCYPLLYTDQRDEGDWQGDVDKRFAWATDLFKARGMLRTGDTVIGIQGSDKGRGSTSTIRYFPPLE